MPMCENCDLIEKHYKAVLKQELIKQYEGLKEKILHEVVEIELSLDPSRSEPNILLALRRVSQIRKILS